MHALVQITRARQVTSSTAYSRLLPSAHLIAHQIRVGVGVRVLRHSAGIRTESRN